MRRSQPGTIRKPESRLGLCPYYVGKIIVLYFENVEMAPCELTRALFSLRLQGWFDNLSGVLIGRSAAPDISYQAKYNYLDALKAAFEDVTVPVLYNVDIGHVPPQISPVNGVDATIFFAENGSFVTQQL